jgi:3-oxoacyl-[acyl-carrier-protein] synthase II
LPVLTGCCGVQPQLREEHAFLQGLAEHGIAPAIRATSTVLGSTVEAQFPLNIALASLAVSRRGFFDPLDDSGVERDWQGPLQRVLVSNWGYWRGEALGLVDAPDAPLRGDQGL